MYRQTKQPNLTPENFELPFGGKLSPDNRWVIMADLIPWSEFEEEYAKNFSAYMGAVAKPFRMALGALIVKEKLGTSDRETVEQIRKNPYLQYFIGLSSYSNEAPFEPSMLVHFRKRIDLNLVNKVNQKMVKIRREQKVKKEKETKEQEEIGEIKNLGQLILDATCTPGDISYNYKEFTGYYPESVHVDRIYRTQKNRAWCKERGIRISGPKRRMSP